MQPLPPNVRVKNGAYHYDMGRDDEGKRSWKKLSRIADGHHALFKALADVTSPRTRTLGDLFNKYLASKNFAKLAPATQRDYAGYIHRTLRPWGGHCDPNGIVQGDIAQLLQTRLEADAAVVANREVACLSTVFNYGMRTKDCAHNPCHGVSRNPQPPRTRYIQDDEFTTAFNAAPEAFQDFMAALYLTGLRQGDIRRLKRSQITPQGIRIEQGKTRKTVIVSMSDALRYFIIRAQTRAPSSPYVFTNSNGEPWTVWAIQSQSRRLKGKDGWTLHDIRAKAESDHSEGLGLLPLYRRAQRITPVR